MDNDNTLEEALILCKKCGREVYPLDDRCPECNYVIKRKPYSSDKSKTLTFILAAGFGFLGLHRFYVGKKWKGLIYLFTLGLFGIGWIRDIIKIQNDEFKDDTGNIIRY